MGRAGRKRKQGKRTKSGQLSRAGEQRFDKGSEWVQAQRERYGEHYNSALGRAFASGLLNDPEDHGRGKDRYDATRKLLALYRRVIGRDRYRCALDRSPVGIQEYTPTEQDADDQEWLLVNLARIDNTGCRPFFDQLTGSLFTDYGPPWLDRLLDAKVGDRRDRIVLDAAIMAIDAIGPVNGAVIRNRLRDVA